MSRLTMIRVKKLTAFPFILLLTLPILAAQGGSHEEGAATMSDREKQGLRGSVKSYTEWSSFQYPNGEVGFSEARSESTTEYDPNGRILALRTLNSDGSQWMTRHEYSPSGQLLKSSYGTEGKDQTNVHYSYDQQGRLRNITTDGKEQTPVSFRYNEHGRKTKVETSRAEDYRPNVAIGGSPFDAASEAPNLPGGGTSTTIYDENDRPTEAQVRNNSGDLVSHVSRKYDTGGCVIEETLIVDNPVSMFSPEARANLLDESGLSPDQLRQEITAQLTKLMGGKTDTYSISYRYDSSGHLIHTERRIYNHEEEIETTYNEHGDITSETTRGADGGSSTAASQSWYSEVRYSYEYDQHGNWTTKTVSYRSSPEAAFELPSVINRSLTYY